MKLTILGMNGPYPAAGGACSGYLVTQGETCVQFDMGTGTLAALTARMTPERLTALVFSHWHFDHCSDVLPLLYRLGGDVVMDVYGPEDESSPVRQQVAMHPSIRLHTLQRGDVVKLGNMTVTALEARHPVPALMYRIEAEGRVLAYSGDTNTTEDLPALAHEADLLLIDGLFPAEMWAEGKPHLSAVQTAQLARDAGAKQLVITHLNPAIDPQTLLKQAREFYIGAHLAACGDTYRV